MVFPVDGATDLEHGWASDLPAALDERLECVADVIRTCGLNAGCTLELRDMLTDCVAALDRSVRELRGDGQIDSHKCSGEHGKPRYRTESLVKFLTTANMVRNNKDISDIIRLCVQITIPPKLLQLIRISEDTPSPTTSSRYAVTGDLAYCRWWRGMAKARGESVKKGAT